MNIHRIRVIAMVSVLIFIGGMLACVIPYLDRDNNPTVDTTITDTTTESTIEDPTTEATTEPTTEPIIDIPEVTTETTVEPTTEPTTESIIDIPETTVETTVETTIETTPVEADGDIDPESVELLACVIYQEAGADYTCDECRRRVADVVLNRVESELFPNTIREVLTQKSQYGRFHWTGVVWPKRSGSEIEANAIARAYRIAEEVLRGQHSDLYGKGYIWQAEFKQGRDIIFHCNTYFGR